MCVRTSPRLASPRYQIESLKAATLTEIPKAGDDLRSVKKTYNSRCYSLLPLRTFPYLWKIYRF